ncbi:hypothetical protein [Leifsonia sp. 1010]|uniref:hypothetical protein n=1 Tax=Leifsonia sp. 1010 TaxID=2817769 RepID=UPI00285FA294|nr:hypothetical protein [Leifsonia sp. 1010]MDR6610912.1 hypothetical protein [Leifsonia sp. 1010]
MRRASASDAGVARRAGVAGLTLMMGLSLASPAGAAAWADAGSDSGVGPSGDGSLQLLPEVITNDGVSAGGSIDFPVRAELFLAPMNERAASRELAEASIPHVIESTDFAPHVNPLFVRDYSGTRERLFESYTPQELPAETIDRASQSNDFWYTVMIVAALPLTLLMAFIGWKTASRRRRTHGRSAH